MMCYRSFQNEKAEWKKMVKDAQAAKRVENSDKRKAKRKHKAKKQTAAK